MCNCTQQKSPHEVDTCFYGTEMSITAFKTVRNSSLSWAWLTQNDALQNYFPKIHFNIAFLFFKWSPSFNTNSLHFLPHHILHSQPISSSYTPKSTKLNMQHLENEDN